MIGHMWVAAVALAGSPLVWMLALCLTGYGITLLVARRG